MTETVVVTGAAAGVGRAAARAFGERGCRVALLARGEDGLRAAAGEIESAGGRALVLPCDVADPEAVEAAAGAVEEAFGAIDIWVNVAMATIFGPVHRITPAEFRRATEVSYLGFVYGTMAALKRMRPRNRGTIVQVGSALSYRAVPLQSAYCGAKFAIRGFTQSLHSEIAARRRRHPSDDGANAGAEYAAIHLGAQQDGAAAAAGAADFPARGGGPGDHLCGLFPTARGMGRMAQRQSHPRDQGRARPAKPVSCFPRIHRPADGRDRRSQQLG